MLNGLGTLCRQMRAAVVFATVPHKSCSSGRGLKWDTEALTFTPPPKKPLATLRGVVAIKNEGSRAQAVPMTGLVAASNLAFLNIAGMSAHEAKDRLIKGVPYVMRRQGAEALAEHVNRPKKSGGRFSVQCNTGPAGSGKTVLQRQNMLQLARDFGFLAVEIEFNGTQSVGGLERQSDSCFARLVANRILCYLPKYRDLGWARCLNEIADDFKGQAALHSIEKAVQVLKEALNHEGPVLLAVDELVMAPGSGRDNLSDLCQIMDDSLHMDNANDRILLAVSVYHLVDLGTFVTDSKRELVHQDLPPILPGLLESGVKECLPLWLQIFFNKQRRERLTQKLKLTEVMGTVANLLAESGGHPRRVEALIRQVDELSQEVLHRAKSRNKKTSEERLLASQLQAVGTVSVVSGRNKCLSAMDAKLDLRSTGDRLFDFVRENSDHADERTLVLLKYLFTEVSMYDGDARILRSATRCHYQLVPYDIYHVGYLPLPSLQAFCDQQLGKCKNKKLTSFLEHAKGVADANLSVARKGSHDAKLPESADLSDTRGGVHDTKRKNRQKVPLSETNESSKHFKMGMFHALCGAVLARECLTENMFRRAPDLPKTTCTEIEWAKDIKLFPNAVEDGTTLRVCDDETLRRIFKVGAVNEQDGQQMKSSAGLAFVPTDRWNMCCDFVLVLPTKDRERAGRVVLAVQCKHWAGDVGGDGLHALAHFRYGRHCFEADQVYAGKYKSKGGSKTGKTKGVAERYAHSWWLSMSRTACVFHRLANSFRATFCNSVEQNKDSDTRVVFVLATVNDITQARVKASVFNRVNLPDDAKYKSTALLEDEGLMDLQHMCHWCPTVGYGALLAEKLREFSL